MSDNNIGFVVIGRNEGERLVRALDALPPPTARIVYVDSGSSDGSVEMATARGVRVVRLDVTHAFTAGRARNEGFDALRTAYPDVEFVQFIDGDCELNSDWLAKAMTFLSAHPEVAAVCGRRRERFPEKSVYNRICDREWNTVVGEAEACGGDALMRAGVFAAQDGFNPAMMAGEEPELCHRIQAAGYKIWRIDAEMTIHDAAMFRFRQWWLRGVRSGYGYAQVYDQTRHSDAPLYGRNIRRAMIWAVAIPAAALALLIIKPVLTLVVLALYPLQVARIAKSTAGPDRWAYAALMTVTKFAEAQGIFRFWRRGKRQAASAIIYK